MEKKPSITDVLPRVRHYYKKHPAGGCLHLVLDDGNLDNKSIEFCRDYAIQNNDDHAMSIAVDLLYMSNTQRRKLYRKLHDEQ